MAQTTRWYQRGLAWGKGYTACLGQRMAFLFFVHGKLSTPILPDGGHGFASKYTPLTLELVWVVCCDRLG